MVLPDKRNRRKKGHRCAPVCEQLEKLTPSHTSESEAESQETSVGLSMVKMKQHGFSVMLVKFGGILQNFAGCLSNGNGHRCVHLQLCKPFLMHVLALRHHAETGELVNMV